MYICILFFAKSFRFDEQNMCECSEDVCIFV